MLRAACIMAAFDAGVPRRDVRLAARRADPRTTTIYDRRRQNLDRHAAYVVAFVTSGWPVGADQPAFCDTPAAGRPRVMDPSRVRLTVR